MRATHAVCGSSSTTCECCAQLHFTDDAQEPVFELKHKLKLYSGEDQQANQNPKKPVRPLTRSCRI